jgi:alpha-D-ribose 1-methylphosphonate 5-triphosphate synthase subunit PhnL
MDEDTETFLQGKVAVVGALGLLLEPLVQAGDSPEGRASARKATRAVLERAEVPSEAWGANQGSKRIGENLWAL